MKERIVELLKEIIDREGPNYLTDYPFEVYLKMKEDPDIDPEMSASLLHTLVLDIAKPIRGSKRIPKDALAEQIKQKCHFTQKDADWFADLYLSLYSNANKAKWKGKKNSGLQEFLKRKWVAVWDGYSRWDDGNVYVECTYMATFTISALDSWKADKTLEAELRRNPFLTDEDVAQHYIDRLNKYLDGKFNWYCTCDDYYPPVAEDFEAEEYVEDWCKENAFELVDFEGDGNTSDYIPNDGFY